jgi:glucuronoarabinoxylan endo-1,4-beta-xylanase
MEYGKEAAQEYSAYIKGDSLIVMAIDTTSTGYGLKMKLPYKVKSGVHILSTGNEKEDLCQKSVIDIAEPTDNLILDMPARSLNTYILMIDKGSTAIENVEKSDKKVPKTYYDLHGRRLNNPHGLCIERSIDGTSRKIMIR